ncbi:MAG: GDSL-type esterase/lipase family protein [Odoribacter sp.]|nr:GDSL-type esterase/lipase family protein [Odoribacter sp.]
MENRNDNGSRGIFVIFATALVTLIVLSLLPWGDVTNNLLKDFSLLSDLVPQSDKTYITHEELDPELTALNTETFQTGLASAVSPDSSALAADGPASPLPILPEDFSAPTAPDGTVLIEDYSPSGRALTALRSGLESASASKFRIAFIGDSYIEGDIFTQDIRAMLQERYGGSGVGYMAAFSQFPGFRQSVTQAGNGWEGKEIRKMGTDDYRVLAGQYFTASAEASASFKGTKRPAHTDSWDRASLLYIAPVDGTIDVSASGDFSQQYAVTASPDVQALVVDRHMSAFSFSTDIDGLIVFGVWLESASGVQLDCMSLRGNSGISHRNLNAQIIGRMRDYVDYDLIILEFGINALSSEQTDYSTYSKAMMQVVENIRNLYPRSEVLLLGIGDRGQKQGTEVGSMSTAPAMVMAQREAARATGTLFFDTRAAMGGNGAVVDWHRRGLVNSDYIHLNHKGGKVLAEIFVNSINHSIGE